MVMDIKNVLVKVGPQHLAKGIERALIEADKIIVGWPVQPSLVGNVAMTLIGVGGALMAPSPFDEILAILGGHHSTTLWDYLEAGLVPPPPPAAQLRAGQTFIPTTGQFVPTRPGLGTTVKYAPEQRVVSAPKFIPGVLRPKYQHGA